MRRGVCDCRRQRAACRGEKKGTKVGVTDSKGFGTVAPSIKEKPPVFGMIEWGRAVVIRIVENVQQKTIQPLLKRTIATGSLVYTDEYAIYDTLAGWGYEHKSVCHGDGEYARDKDGDGFCQVHVNTMKGFCFLLRSCYVPVAVFRNRAYRSI